MKGSVNTPLTRPLHHRLGLGFNPNLLSGHIEFPKGFDYLEAGMEFFEARCTSGLVGVHEFSLHLSRAPFCEPPSIQDRFLARLARKLPSEASTIGLHLCGPYNTGLGCYGLGTGFTPTTLHKRRARRFISKFQSAIKRPLLIENANYYDEDAAAAVETLKFTNDLCRTAGVEMILDVTHLVIVSRNLGLEPSFFLGMVDLDVTRVVHVSGLTRSADGMLHDGHNREVHSEVWRVISLLLRVAPRPMTFVLEHTDPSWGEHPAAFGRDAARLSRALTRASSKGSARVLMDWNRIGAGFMANIVMPQRFPELMHAIGRDRFGELVRVWAKDFVSRRQSDPDAIVALRRTDFSLGRRSIDPIEDFLVFVQNFYQ